jgi:hypothetical protein
MNQAGRQDVEQHVPILGWLLIVSHAIFLVVGVFVFVLLTGIGAFSGDQQAFAILTIVAICVAALMAVLALPGILAGYGLLQRKSWGRVLALIVAVLNIFNFPIGTMIAGYALWVLLQPAATTYFAPPRASYS